MSQVFPKSANAWSRASIIGVLFTLLGVGWVILTLQVLSIVIGAIGRSVSTPAHPIDIDAGFSINGWLAVLLTFLLARVFAAGAAMRDDLEGTV